MINRKFFNRIVEVFTTSFPDVGDPELLIILYLRLRKFVAIRKYSPISISIVKSKYSNNVIYTFRFIRC